MSSTTTTTPAGSTTRFWKSETDKAEPVETRPPPLYDDNESKVDWSPIPRGLHLRPYQEDALQAVTDALDGGFNRVGVSSPTGSGKTVMFAALIPRVPAKEGRYQVLILVHNIELARQAQKTLESIHRAKYLIGLEQGGSRTDGDRDITIATWQSLLQPKRLAKFKPESHKLIIADEAHHNAAPSYIKILKYFNNEVSTDTVKPSSGPKVPIVGFSATFARGDEKKLGWVYQEVVYDIDIQDLLKTQYLCPVVIRSGMNRIHDLAGDYKVKDVPANQAMYRKKPRSQGSGGQEPDDDRLTATVMSKIAADPRFPGRILKTYQDEAAGCKSTLIFVSNLAKVDAVVEVFNRAGIKTGCIDSRTEHEDRVKTLQQFKNGVFPVMVNCLCLTEGTDLPIVDCVILARMTQSKNYFSQMIGRGLRLWPSTGKEACFVIDLFDICTKYGLGVKPNLWGDSQPNNNLERLEEKIDRDEEIVDVGPEVRTEVAA